MTIASGANRTERATVALGLGPAAPAILLPHSDSIPQQIPPQIPNQKICKADLGREDLTPLTFCHYRLGRRIGSGGMGIVYLAHHLHLGKTFAIKFVSSEALDNTEAVSRFVQETAALGQLNHPHIVSAVDAGVADGIPYYVTELLDGHDLKQYVEQKQIQPVAAACEIIRQAALGLGHAHDRGFLHRDIKPANLFLETRGNVKLLDFGLVSCTHTASELTCEGQMMGTVDYFSPEQSEDPRCCSPSSDIYSLGATLIYLLSGQPPFPNNAFPTLVSKLRGHLSEQPPWLSQAASTLPRKLKQLIESMLAKSPKARPQSCREVADALTQWACPTELARWQSESNPPAHETQRSTSIRTNSRSRWSSKQVLIPAMCLGSAASLAFVISEWWRSDAVKASSTSLIAVAATSEAAQVETARVQTPTSESLEASEATAEATKVTTIEMKPRSAKAMNLDPSNNWQTTKRQLGPRTSSSKE